MFLLIVKDNVNVLTYCKGQYPGARYAWKAHEAYPPLQTLQAPKPANRIYRKYMFATPANRIYMKYICLKHLQSE